MSTDTLFDSELDESEFLDEECTQIYQSLIGPATWLVQLGIFDIALHIMTLSSFLAQPRHGYLDRSYQAYYWILVKDGRPCDSYSYRYARLDRCRN